MPNARGILVLDAIRFVQQTFGPSAHEQVLQHLPAERRASFLGQIREASWEPLEDAVAYIETAKRLFAAEDETFYRKLGHYSGSRDRTQGGFQPMLADPTTALKMAPTAWRAYFDSGRLELELKGSSEVWVRVKDFPAYRSLCERRCGAWEGLLSSPKAKFHVEETACAAKGSPECLFSIVWEVST